jgi:hypothetical protein
MLRRIVAMTLVLAFVFAMIPAPASAFAQSCERYRTCITVYSCAWYGANCAAFHPEEWSLIINGYY